MFCLAAVAILLVSASQALETEDLFVSGTLDASQPYPVFRIPALCRTASGTLLAFAEARRAINDQSSNILVLRRRPGRAKQWGPLQIVAEDRLASLNNPCVLVDGRSVWLMYQRYPYGYNERTASAGLEPEQSCRTFVISSSDDGKTWTAPTELTATVKRSGIRSDASGPGIGIVLRRGAHAGRLVFPLNEGADGAYTAFSVYSDDRGATWAPRGSRTQGERATA